jgi:hypothetical protein
MNNPFKITSIHQTMPFFEEQIVTCMFARYIFNALGEKYCQLGEL